MPNDTFGGLDYEQHYARYVRDRGSETGNASDLIDRETWDQMSNQQRWDLINQSGAAEVRVRPGEPGYDQLAQQTGAEEGRDIVISPVSMAPRGYLVDPRKEVAGEGWFAHAENNQTPDFQELDDMDETQAFMRSLAAASVFYGGGQMLEGLSGTAGESAAFTAGTNAAESGGTLMLDAAGTGTVPYVPSGAASAAGAATSGLPPTSTPSGPPATQPPAPASSATPTPTPTTTGGGILDTARNAWSSTSGWYNGLSPAGRMVVNGAISQGVQGLAGANAQREVQQENERREEEQRQDRIRRTSIPAFGSAFTPRGIINGTRRPGG